MVNSPGEFFWSSYPAFIGKIKTPDWLETGWLLATFGRKKKEAVNYYINNLYSFQDLVLKLIMKVDDTFYLNHFSEIEIALLSEDFARIFIHNEEYPLKIEPQ